MSILKFLVKLNNRLASTWQHVDFTQNDIRLRAGWYICEFVVAGVTDVVPRLLLENAKGHCVERTLLGFHGGRNRMLVYLPEGQLKAYSRSLEFERLARVSGIEGRLRVLLICFRYLLDFFSLKTLFKMLVMQFQDSTELSNDLLAFYAPDASAGGYLKKVKGWHKYRGFNKQLTWLVRKVRIAVVIENDSQRVALTELLVQPDAILMAGDDVPSDIEYCLPLAVTEHLREPAILMLKRAINKSSTRPNLVYTDHDYTVQTGPNALHPVFKPSPSRAYLHCFNYVGFAMLVNTEMLPDTGTQALFDTDIQYSLALQAFTQLDKVLHVDEALIRSDRTAQLDTPAPLSEQSPWPNIDWLRSGEYNRLRANQAWKQHPSIDLLIPTRDGLAVLKPCVDSILSKTTYQNYHVVIVDNGSELPETLAYFEELQKDPRVKVVAYPGEFNYSAINNFAARHGSAEYIGLVNNDIEVIDGDWLTQMMVWATQSKVGIVGAKLLFGNGKIQHAGVTIGMGNAAGHIHRLEVGDAPGYQYRCLATQNMMAVTAACLVTPRALFEQVGGLDEENFKVAYNDIDYCLRVESAGYEIMWTPEACLYHHESVSRGDDLSDVHVERYFRELGALQKRWKCKGFVDKYYSKHLRISDEGVFPQTEHHAQDELIFLESTD
ncbi:glycosyltransferase family 2 protein [Arenicella xantha]|uniref:GT2 family glycosyltransferase n=1 Tax=Arenicella xantha TaxID=644221 RepID=A0A395JFK7_9GAMM|nr:glycosyltransferase family 2 protein [Arenicella xantha]RBP48447.1 GT2 family glycosyltransferase [Arenicella xantha]